VYYTDPDLVSAAVTQTDTAVSFDWASGSPSGSIPAGASRRDRTRAPPRPAAREDALGRADGFSVQWSGKVLAAYRSQQQRAPISVSLCALRAAGARSEVYTFFVQISGGSGTRLVVNGVTLVDAWTMSSGAAPARFLASVLMWRAFCTCTAPSELSGSISLAAGSYYTVSLQYRNLQQLASVRLLWQSVSTCVLAAALPQRAAARLTRWLTARARPLISARSAKAVIPSASLFLYSHVASSPYTCTIAPCACGKPVRLRLA
jgi:hypothetical protein